MPGIATTPARPRPGSGWVALLAAALLVAACSAGATGTRSIPGNAVLVNVAARPVTRPLARGYVGLSIEFPSSIAYSGTSPRRLDPVFLQLVRNLNPGQAPVIRFGGDTTDWTWWPVAGMRRPRGIRYTLTRRWLAVTAATARALDARLILGVNLEADSRRLAAVEARAMLRGLGPQRIAGFELGNEPEAYSTLGWYYINHTIPVLGRRPGYGLSAYLRDYASVAGALPRGVPLVGPASGAPDWLSGLGRDLSAEPRVRVATFHRYPLHRCATARTSLAYPSIPHLLAPVASSGPARSLSAAVAVAHAHGIPFRTDELNSVSCGGAHGVSDTFASALWAIDTLFNMDRVGVDGVNIHTFRSGTYAPFTVAERHGRWLARVRPMYYGLLLFTRSAPPGSRLLALSHRGPPTLRIWTTRGADGRERVVLINDSENRPVTVAVRLPGPPGSATVARLRARDLSATHGVRIAGQSYGVRSATGHLAGAPVRTTISPIRGRLVVAVPPASAALVTTSAH